VYFPPATWPNYTWTLAVRSDRTKVTVKTINGGSSDFYWIAQDATSITYGSPPDSHEKITLPVSAVTGTPPLTYQDSWSGFFAGTQNPTCH
jgi:hypothetical protein